MAEPPFIEITVLTFLVKKVHQIFLGCQFFEYTRRSWIQISNSSFSSTNLKVSNDNEELKKHLFYGMDSYFSKEIVFSGLFF